MPGEYGRRSVVFLNCNEGGAGVFGLEVCQDDAEDVINSKTYLALHDDRRLNVALKN